MRTSVELLVITPFVTTRGRAARSYYTYIQETHNCSIETKTCELLFCCSDEHGRPRRRSGDIKRLKPQRAKIAITIPHAPTIVQPAHSVAVIVPRRRDDTSSKVELESFGIYLKNDCRLPLRLNSVRLLQIHLEQGPCGQVPSSRPEQKSTGATLRRQSQHASLVERFFR